MEVSTTVDGTKATMSLVGKLTVVKTPDLEAAFTELPEDVTNVVLDLSELDYVASAGLRVIVSQTKRLHQSGGALCIVHPNEEVMEVFEVTGLVDVLDVER